MPRDFEPLREHYQRNCNSNKGKQLAGGGSKDVEWNTSDAEAEDRWRGAVVNSVTPITISKLRLHEIYDFVNYQTFARQFSRMRGRRAERDRRERDRRDHDSWERERYQRDHERHEPPDQRDRARHERHEPRHGRNRSVPPEPPLPAVPPRDKELKEPREPREPRPIRTGVEIFRFSAERENNPNAYTKYVCFNQEKLNSVLQSLFISECYGPWSTEGLDQAENSRHFRYFQIF